MPTAPEYMPSLITPFTRNGEVDTKAHVANVRTLAGYGMEGFVIGGSNGEGPYLEPGDRHQLIKSVRRRKAFLVAGIAAESTRQALAAVSEVEEAGADAILVMTPTTLARGDDETVLNYYRAIANGSELPVILYSVPRVTAYNLAIELVWRLSRHENIIGIKDSSGDVVRLQSIVDGTPADFLVYSGASRALSAAMAVGCHGAITGSGCYVPDLVLKTIRTAKENPGKARGLQKRLSRISADVEAHGIPGVKAAAKAAGLEPGYPRQPLTKLSKGAETSIAKLVQV